MAQKKDVVTGKWYFYGKYTDEVGNSKQYKKRGYEKKKDAKEAELKFLREIELGATIKTVYTFSQVVDNYVKQNKEHKKSTTQVDADTFRKINQVFGRSHIKKIKSSDLQKYINLLDKNYSKRYVIKIYYAFNKIFKYAIAQDLILNNPMEKVKYSSRKDEIPEKMDFWEPEEFKTFINSYTDLTIDYVIINLLYFTGLRRGEALALTWNDIDMKNSIIDVHKAVTFRIKGVSWLISTPKTKNSIRKISIPSNLLLILKKWKDNQKRMYEFSENRFVFGFDRPLAPETLRQKYIRQIKKANSESDESKQIKQIRIHDLRHSHASYLINNKGDRYTDFDIANRLGDTVQTLHETYAHWFKDSEINIMNQINKDFF